MMFLGISQHLSEGFPGCGAVLRTADRATPRGRGPRGAFRVSEGVLEQVHFGAKHRRI